MKTTWFCILLVLTFSTSWASSVFASGKQTKNKEYIPNYANANLAEKAATQKSVVKPKAEVREQVKNDLTPEKADRSDIHGMSTIAPVGEGPG